MEHFGERIQNVPTEPMNSKKRLGKLLVASELPDGNQVYGTRVLSPNIPKNEVTTTSNNGFSGGSYRTMDLSNTMCGDMYNIKVSTRMQITSPDTRHHSPPPLTYNNLAQPEDDRPDTQKLAIGTYRSTSVDVTDQMFNSNRFLTHKPLANQTVPYSPDRENVSLFVQKMQLQSTEKFSCEEDTTRGSGFLFQDAGATTQDNNLVCMINEIDNELSKVVPGEENVVNDDFQPVNQQRSVVAEETVPSLGVKLRTGGPKPEGDLSNLNIILTSPPVQYSLEYQKAVNALLLKIKAEKKADVTPSSNFIERRVVFGTDKACKEMLEKSEILPSDGTHGVILYDRLRPKSGVYMDPDHYKVTETLGKGMFGEVTLCQDRTTMAKFVRKQVPKDYKKSEVEVMMSLKHQNITRFYGVIKREGVDEILMEYSGESLLTFTVMPKTQHLVTEEFIWNVNRQGLSAIDFLEIYGIIHLDIKPENVCILETATGWTVKLTDFGSAKLPHEQLTYHGWTAEYMSPEACGNLVRSRFPQISFQGENWPVTSKSDVYSWGLTVTFMYRKIHLLMHMFTGGENSYKNVENPGQVKLRIIISMAQNPDMVRQCLIPDDCSQDMKRILSGILAGNPSERLSAKEAVATIDKISADKLLATEKPLIDLDCYICEPTDVTSPTPGPSRIRRPSSVSSCMSSQDSVNSSMSYASNTSRKTGPYGRSRRRNVKRELRDRIESPRNEMLENLSPMVELDGNVPNFAALV
ncbi:uncharacterized protein [Argopecten irradians]|uniref:uncharacterized protein n=1 Tax=Argopecten irradians TaxID=31199 RepID=UPI00371B7DD6